MAEGVACDLFAVLSSVGITYYYTDLHVAMLKSEILLCSMKMVVARKIDGKYKVNNKQVEVDVDSHKFKERNPDHLRGRVLVDEAVSKRKNKT